MIDLRYHVVSLIAVFLAIAVGIVVGATQLHGATVDNLRGRVQALTVDNRSLQQSGRAWTEQARTDDAVISALAPQAVAGTLAKVRVVLVCTAQSSSGLTDAVQKELQQAGATVTGRIQLTGDFTDPRRAADIKSFVTGGGQPAGFQLPESDDAAVLGGTLLSYVLVRRDGPGPDRAAVAQVLSGFASLQLARPDSAQTSPADLAVVIAAAPAAGPDAAVRTRALGRLVAALDKAGKGAVVAGTAATAGPDGLVGAVRADAATAAGVSTVDNADTAAGLVATVFAVRQQITGGTGQYGQAGSAQAPLPPTRP